MLAQHFCDGEHQVGGGGAFAEFAVQAESHHFGNEHRRRLAQHGGFRFDAADAPAKHAQRVNHGGVRIGADHGVGVGLNFISRRHGADDAREIFEIYLVADAGVGRHNFKIVESGLAPAQKSVALHVALKFQFGVQAEGVDATEAVHLHGMIDDQFSGEQRIDALGISAHALHRFAHGGQVDDRRHTGKILQQNARGHEGDFFFGRAGMPIGQRLNVWRVDEPAVFAAQQIFQ